MELNKHTRAVALAVFGLVASFQVAAFSGGVQTTYTATPSGNIERVRTGAASTPELDATYQRTIRTAQTRAAAAAAARKILTGVSGLGTLLAVAEFVDAMGWLKKDDASGNPQFTKVDPAFCNTSPCYKFASGDDNYIHPNSRAACMVQVSRYLAGVNTGGGTGWTASVTTAAPYPGIGCQWIRSYQGGDPIPGTLTPQRQLVPPQSGTAPRVTVEDAELEDRLKSWDDLPELLEELDKKGNPVGFPDPEVEDLPQPIELTPRTTTRPDGSKTIEQTTLTPTRGPDGKTVNWDKTVTTTEISKPDAQGNTTQTITTTTSTSSGDKPVPPEKSECEKSPDTLGCALLDSPTGEIPKSSKDITYAPETMFAGGACPPPKTVTQTLTGRPIVFSFQPTCDALSNYVKPLIIAIALFMAYLIILPGRTD